MVAIDIQDKRPIYMQLVEGIKERVLKGFFQPGDQLHSVKELASELVMKAYKELERQSVINISTIGRGKYIFVNDVLGTRIDELKREEFVNLRKRIAFSK
ncbi:MAG: hypothetical protein ATN31_09940 [Candidatus Epulonipiscioides saccharophilum]|nr:MAG: hypothetical protein ATN31_09940 [Epulopiscium sp. AS2M-Bin001]